MKKSIAVLALSASSTSAFAFMMQPQQTKTYCLSVYEGADGAKFASSCDESKNNEILGKDLLENGCAEDQVALTARKHKGQKKFDIQISACLPPNVVQL
jgi:hypothetical protein